MNLFILHKVQLVKALNPENSVCYHAPMTSLRSSTVRLKTELADRSWESMLSNLLSPPLLWAMIALPVAFRDAGPDQHPLLWAAIYALFVCLLPALYIGINVLRGSISDLHLRERRQRHRPYLVTILSASSAWVILSLLDASLVMRALALFSLANVVVMAAITVFWQISMHTMSMSSALMALALLFSAPLALVVSPLLPLVYAARHRLGRHSHRQLLGGAFLGALLPLALYLSHPI